MRRSWLASIALIASAALAQSPAARIAGTVTDPRGHALAGCTVHVDGNDARRATTDERGAFELAMPAGRARLVVEREGFCRVRTPDVFLPADAVRSIPLTLQPCVAVAGTVLAAPSTPRAGARVRIDLARVRPSELRAGSENEGSFENGVIEATTGPDGRFRIEQVPVADGYRLEVRHPDHPPFERRLDLASSRDAASLSLQLPRAAELRGTFKGADDKPAPDVEVVAIDLASARDGGDVAKATSAADGTFRLRPLAAGRYRLEVHPPSGVTQYRGPLELTAGQQQDLGVMKVAPGAAIAGRLVDRDRQPVATARVVAIRVLGDVKKRERTTTSDAQGAFTLKGLAEGRYDVRVEAEEPFGRTTREAVPAPARAIEIVVPRAGSLTGRVVAQGAHCSLERLRVRAWDMSQPDYPRPVGKPELLVPQQGTFRITGVPAGDVAVSAVARGCIGARSKVVRVGEGPLAEPLDLALADGLAVEGTVVDAKSGAGVAGAAVRLDDAADDDVPTDAGGRFRLAGARAGQNFVSVHHPDFAAARVAVVVDAEHPQPITVPLTPGAALTGTVKLADGRPVPDARIELVLEDAAPRSTITGAGGDYRFEHLPSGTGIVRRLGGGDRFDEHEQKQAALVDGETATVDFTLGGVVEGRVTKSGLPLAGVRLTLAFAPEPAGGRGENIGREYVVRSAWTDPNGEYRLEGIAPGPSTLMLALEGQRSTRRVLVPDAPTYRLDIAAPSRMLTGTVVEARTGNPVAGAQVRTGQQVKGLESSWMSVQSESDDLGGEFSLYLGGTNEDSTFSGTDGSFTLWTDDGPARTVNAWSLGSGSGSIDVRPDDTKPLRIPLTRPATLLVHPRGPSGEPIAGVHACTIVRADDPNARPNFSTSCTSAGPSDVQGEFTFQWRAGDKPELVVSAPGFAAQRRQLPALRADGDPNVADLRLERGGSVLIRLNAPAALESILGPDGHEYTPASDQVTTTKDAIRIDGLAPGTYRFTLGGTPVSAPVRAGETTEVPGP